jgi:hypothetical protein
LGGGNNKLTEVEVVTPIDMEFEDVPVISPRLGISTGQPGSGKTVLLFSWADRVHEETGKPIYVVMKPYDRKLKHMAPDIPKHIRELRDLGKLGDDSDNPLQDAILIGDDWKRIAHARRAMSNINVVIDNLMGIIRHDDLDILIDDQTASSIDRNNIIRSNYLWVKPPFRKELELGRGAMLEEITLAYSLDLGQKDVLLYNEDVGDGPMLVKNIPLPVYWTEELSRMHRRQPRGFMQRLKL